MNQIPADQMMAMIDNFIMVIAFVIVGLVAFIYWLRRG